MLTPNKLLLTPNKLLFTPDEMTTAIASAKKRPAMSKQSPYSKTVVKAAKTVPKKHYTVKVVASAAAKSVQARTTPTKAESLQRARAWARRELGEKKKSSSETTSHVSAPAAGRSERAMENVTMSDCINKEMLNTLDQAGDDNNFIVGDISEDVFYDAMDFEPLEEEVVVENASDDEEDEQTVNLR